MAEKQQAGFRSFATLGALLVPVAIWLLTPGGAAFKQSSFWQSLVAPGDLSPAHASLQNDCAACHTAVKGAEPVKCIACHANDEELLRREDTAFHANVGTCNDCHREHQGGSRSFTEMDHAVLTAIGFRQLRSVDPRSESEQVRRQFLMWMRHVDESSMPHPGVSEEELILDCAACHRNEDPHVAYFGDDCASCHSTRYWTIARYIHPPAISKDCEQCHKAPTSHFMPMFMSMCAKKLGKSPKSVNQCYVCHEISAWNEMKGAPWHKETMSHIPFR